MTRTWQDNAHELRDMDEGEGWPFALRVACSVTIGTTAHRHVAHATRGKVSAREFAEEWGTSADRVLRFLKAWDRAAALGLVIPSDKLAPDDVDTARTPGADEHSWLTGTGQLRYGDTKAKPTGGRPRDSKPEHAVQIIEKRGAAAVVEAMTSTQRGEVLREVVKQETESRELRAMADGGRYPSMDAVNAEVGKSPIDGIIAHNRGFEEASDLASQLIRKLDTYPPQTETEEGRVRSWSLRLLEVLDKVRA